MDDDELAEGDFDCLVEKFGKSLSLFSLSLTSGAQWTLFVVLLVRDANPSRHSSSEECVADSGTNDGE
jgi:hypothetical protein